MHEIYQKSLVTQILAGDQQAFKEFIESYQRLVGHVVARLIVNPSDRADISQDIFLKIYRNLRNFHFESKISTWVAKIAYNTCLNFLARKKVKLFTDEDLEDGFLNNLSDTAIRPDIHFEQTELQQRLQSEIQKLPIQYRTIITLYHLDEMSYREIGTVLQIPEGTVKSYLFRGRKILKERLKAHFQLEEVK
jgi:RNA polymerase sigma-70 factor (ECF subfamily)